MAKFEIKWTPTEGGSARSWVVDVENPSWDLMYQTEKATDWPWSVFIQKVGEGSAIALRALLFTLRKRTEPKLTLDAVEIQLSEFDVEELDEPSDAEPDPEA